MNRDIPQIINITRVPHLNALLSSFRGSQADCIRNFPSFGDEKGNSYLVIVTSLYPQHPHNIDLQGHIGFQNDVMKLIEQYGYSHITPELIGPAFSGKYNSVTQQGIITIS